MFSSRSRSVLRILTSVRWINIQEKKLLKCVGKLEIINFWLLFPLLVSLPDIQHYIQSSIIFDLIFNKYICWPLFDDVLSYKGNEYKKCFVCKKYYNYRLQYSLIYRKIWLKHLRYVLWFPSWRSKSTISIIYFKFTNFCLMFGLEPWEGHNSITTVMISISEIMLSISLLW